MSDLTLYLPIGLISSEKLLILSGFVKPNQLRVEFVYDSQYEPDYTLSHKSMLNGIILPMTPYDSSDLGLSKESSLNSSIDQSSYTNRRVETKKKSQFDTHFKLNKMLESKRPKLAQKDQKCEKAKDINMLMKNQPVLLIEKGKYITNFVDIVMMIVETCELTNPSLQLKRSEKEKFINYMLYVEQKIDYHANNLLYEMYRVTEDNKMDQFHVMSKNLRQLLKKLEFFETFIFVKNEYLFGDTISLADFMLFGSLLKIFIFFFDKKIRTGCLHKTTQWFKSFLKMTEIQATFGAINLCIKNFISSFENVTEYSLRKLKVPDNKFESIFSIDSLKTCLQHFLRLRVKEKSIKGDENMSPVCCRPKKKINNAFNNKGIYKECSQINDLNTLICKIEETELNLFTSESHSVWVFDFIKEDDSEESRKDTEREINEFFDELGKQHTNMKEKFICYVVVFSNCEEFKGELNFEENIEICPEHDPNLFLSKSLKGLIIKEGDKPIDFISNYEGLDQILLHKQEKDNAIDTIKDFIHQRDFFSMERINKEIII